MKKTLLAVAVAAALPAVGYAQTNVTLSGIIKAGVTSHKLSNGTCATGVECNGTGSAVGDGSSRIIVAGTEDLGGGLRATFQFDNRLRPDDAGLANNAGSGVIANELANGNSWVGLAGGWGQVRLGRLDQYYGLGTDEHGVRATALTASNISILSYLNGSSTAAPATRMTNLLRFDSANYSGLTFGLGYSFAYAGPEGYVSATQQTSVGNNQKGSAIVADVGYAAGPISAGLSYVDAKNEPKTAGTKGLRVAGKYNFGMFSVGLTFDQSKNKNLSTNAEAKRNAWSLPVTANLGPGTLLFTYSQAQDVKNNGSTASNTGAKMYSLGYDYPLSKRTSLGVSYAILNNESAAAYAMFTGTALHNMPTPSAGQDSKQLYLGVRHTF